MVLNTIHQLVKSKKKKKEKETGLFIFNSHGILLFVYEHSPQGQPIWR